MVIVFWSFGFQVFCLVNTETDKLTLASSDFCSLLKTFANNLDPDQDHYNVSPDKGIQIV